MDKTSIHQDEIANNNIEEGFTKKDIFEDSFYAQKI
jgi:hypothetical protein